MALKAKKEAPAPPKPKAKAKTLKAKKEVLRGVRSQKICPSLIFLWPKMLHLERQQKYPQKTAPQEEQA